MNVKMRELLRATTGKGNHRSPGYWTVKEEKRGDCKGIARYNDNGEIPFFTYGDANLLEMSPEMHDMLWKILIAMEKDGIFTQNMIALKHELIDLLARVDVEELTGTPGAVVARVIYRAHEIMKNQEANHESAGN